MPAEDDVSDEVSGSECEEHGCSSSLPDSDSWDDEDNSEESSTEDCDSFEKRFLSLVDCKIKSAQTFCDHKQYVFSFTPAPATMIPPSSFDADQPDIQGIAHLSMETQTTEDLDLDGLHERLPLPDLESVIDAARDEIANLRSARDVFVAQRKIVGDRLKHEDSEADSRRLYECEETVDLIDTIIDYKNEIICGRDDISNNLYSDKDETDIIMARLKNLSLTEQRKLFCKFFNKVVELRHSTKQLERNLDQLEDHNEEMGRRVARYQKKMRQQEEGYRDRFKMLMENSKHPNGRQDEPQNHVRHRHEHGLSSRRQEQGPSSRHHPRLPTVYDSVREHHRDRHRNNGPEIIRDHRKITIQMPQHQSQNHH